jgi:hypothetical protein
MYLTSPAAAVAAVTVCLQDWHHGDGCHHGGGTQAQAGSSSSVRQQQKQRVSSSTCKAGSSRVKQQQWQWQACEWLSVVLSLLRTGVGHWVASLPAVATILLQAVSLPWYMYG